MGGEELARISHKKLGFGPLRKTQSGMGHFVPVLYDGKDALSLYTPVMWAPQGVKKWPGKDGQPDKYEIQLVLEDPQRKQFELIDRALKNLTVDRHDEFWKGLGKEGAGYKYNSLIDIPKDRTDLKPSVSLRIPSFGNKFTCHFEDETGAKLDVTPDNFERFIRKGSRIRASVNLTEFILATGAYPVMSIHSAAVLPPLGRPVTQEELSMLRAGIVEEEGDGAGFPAAQEELDIPDVEPTQPEPEPEPVPEEQPKKRARKH